MHYYCLLMNNCRYCRFFLVFFSDICWFSVYIHINKQNSSFHVNIVTIMMLKKSSILILIRRSVLTRLNPIPMWKTRAANTNKSIFEINMLILSYYPCHIKNLNLSSSQRKKVIWGIKVLCISCELNPPNTAFPCLFMKYLIVFQPYM